MFRWGGSLINALSCCWLNQLDHPWFDIPLAFQDSFALFVFALAFGRNPPGLARRVSGCSGLLGWTRNVF